MKLCVALLIIYWIILDLCKITTPTLRRSDHKVLIRSVYDRYQPGAIDIFTTFERTHAALEKYTIFFEFTKIMIDEGTMVVIHNYKTIPSVFAYFRYRTVRPFFVVIIETSRDFTIWIEITRRYNLDRILIFIIFNGYIEPAICHHCRYGFKNIFSLTFKSQVIVKCCDERHIEEWWSSSGSLNRTEIGTWQHNDYSIEWRTNKSLYDRRSTMSKRLFRIGLVKGSSYIREENGTYYGFFGEILEALAESMEFRISITIKDHAYGSYDSNVGAWTGIIGSLIRGEADLGVAEFTMSNERLSVVDFTIPIVIGECRLYFMKPSNTWLQWDAYFQTFTSTSWSVIIGSIISLPLIITVIRNYYKKNPFLPTLFEQYQIVCGIYCQQAMPQFPVNASLRIIYLSILVAALLTLYLYSATLISILAVSVIDLPFNTLEEFANYGKYKLIVLEGSLDYDLFKTSNATTSEKLMHLMKPIDALPKSVGEGFAQVCHENVAFYINEQVANAIDFPCDMIAMSTGHVQSLAMILPYNSQYRELFNYHIQRLRDLGILRQLQQKYLVDKEPRRASHPPVTWGGIAPILYVLIGGIFIACGIFLVERIYDRLSYSVRVYRRKKLMEKYLNNVDLPKKAPLPENFTFTVR